MDIIQTPIKQEEISCYLSELNQIQELKANKLSFYTWNKKPGVICINQNGKFIGFYRHITIKNVLYGEIGLPQPYHYFVAKKDFFLSNELLGLLFSNIEPIRKRMEDKIKLEANEALKENSMKIKNYLASLPEDHPDYIYYSGKSKQVIRDEISSKLD